MNAAIILFSGGLDSTACLYWALEKYEKIILLSFLYGSKEDATIVKVHKKFSSIYKLESVIIKLPFLKKFTKSSGSSLSKSGKKIPSIIKFEQLDSKDFSNKTAKAVWVPGRNMLFISIAAAFGDSLDVPVKILFGANEEEGQTFPDNTTQFVENINNTIKMGCRNDIEVIAPFHKNQKEEIVEFLDKRNAKIKFSSSCYQVRKWTKEGYPIHCGICESCQRRKRAFKKANKIDPTEYHK